MFNDVSVQLQQTFPAFVEGGRENIPGCQTLNHGFSQQNHNQQTLKFIPQNNTMPFIEQGYEERIFSHGLIATRENNWHDFFNAMVWRTFPRTKSAINVLHYQETSQQKDSIRSRKRDLLTLFDESGVVVIANDSILEMIKKHQWQELFVRNRPLWINNSIQIITFGHALYEKYLAPYIGMTAHALLLTSNETDLDDYLSKNFIQQNLLNNKSELSPLPLLGIPLWHKNQTSTFYENSQYFR